MNRTMTLAVLMALAMSSAPTSDALATGTADRDWIKYAEEANGNLHFYDRSRVEQIDAVWRVWNGIRYKTSLMGAFSFNSLLEIDCSSRTEKTLQSTFFSDKNWEQAAMKTDTTVSANRQIEAGSTIERLADIVCAQ